MVSLRFAFVALSCGLRALLNCTNQAFFSHRDDVRHDHRDHDDVQLDRQDPATWLHGGSYVRAGRDVGRLVKNLS